MSNVMGYTHLQGNTINLDETKEKFLKHIMDEIVGYLSDKQISIVERAIIKELSDVEVVDPLRRYDDVRTDDVEELLETFLKAKKVAGLSEKTLRYYKGTILRFNEALGNPPANTISTKEIRGYLLQLMEGGVSRSTTDNIRRILSTFFGWLNGEGLILRNPMMAINKIKSRKKVKPTFTRTDIEKMRTYLNTIINNPKLTRTKRVGGKRDLAMIELLLSSGIRVGELCGIKISDIDFDNKTVRVLGKGNKERVVLFNDTARWHIRRYIRSRDDLSDHLFVSSKGDHKPLGKSGVERRIRDIGKACGIQRAHPHKFRRTFATTLVNNGMPIEKVQALMGHANMDTTMIYVNLNKEEVRLEYEHYMG